MKEKSQTVSWKYKQLKENTMNAIDQKIGQRRKNN